MAKTEPASDLMSLVYVLQSRAESLWSMITLRPLIPPVELT